MADYVVLDLFSGLGGFSAAFEDSEEWDVVTVEIEEQFGPDVCADVMDLRPADLLDALGEYDVLVILASPPCTLFSTAGNHDEWDMEAKEPATERAKEHVALLYHTLGLIRALSPDYWYLENPRHGRVTWFLGQPTGTVTYCQYGRDYMKPTGLWGDHAPMSYHRCQHGDSCHKSNTDDDGTSAIASMDGMNHAERSLVPYELSEAIRDACEAAVNGAPLKQTTLDAVGASPT